MDAQKFGLFLQAQRKALNLTQSQLAERLHVTDKAVSRWERGVGLPDINLLEPLAEALQLSLTELIRSEKIDTDTLTKDAADAAVAETLKLAEKRRRIFQWWLAYALVMVVEIFFICVITWFVDVGWIRSISMFLLIMCGHVGMQAVVRITDPEKFAKRWRISRKTFAKAMLLSASLWLYILIFGLQPYIGLQNCGRLALLLTAVLGIWGIRELWRYVRTMPDGQKT